MNLFLIFEPFQGSPSPSKTLSPSSRPPMMQPSMQSHSELSSANGIPNGAIYNQMQVNYDFPNSNPSGLELAGFCSPSQGKF
jgi:hypothetical protein